MYILAIETTGPLCAVSLVSEEENGGGCRVLGEERSREAMRHLQDLIPQVQRLFTRLDFPKSSLSHIAVSAGPGSFTGIRIGVSTARALGQALGLPVIAVPTLDAFLYKDRTAEAMAGLEAQGKVKTMEIQAGVEAPSDAVVCAILNARRGQVYGMIDGYLPGCPCMLTDVLEIVGGTEGPVRGAGRPVLLYGDGIDAYEGRIVEELGAEGLTLGKEYFFAPETVRYQDAASVGRLALEMARAGKGLQYNDAHPDYMRKTEAEQKLKAGELPICRLPKQE